MVETIASAHVTIYTDGASRGNPGPAGAGVVFLNASGNILARGYRYLGEFTNNEAEYRALLIALEQALARGYKSVLLRADSELLVRQLEGRYRVKSANLQPLHAQALALLARFETWQAEHVPRSANTEADRLANKAIDNAAEHQRVSSDSGPTR
jgi:ribonuclease HI